jgi:predicted MarR family transcription regulator
MNHTQRQFLQYLRHGGWVKVSALPDAPKVIVKLMGLGWIERTGNGSEVSFRITDRGLEALKKPIPLR